MAEPALPAPPRTLGRRDMVLFTVSAILLLDTLAAGASVGVSAISWWLLLGIVFFVPYALICSELGTAWPEQGGLYAWIRHAFGRRWAARATWAYWVNTAVWLPAIFILFAGVFAQLFLPGLALTWQIALGIVLTWVAVAVNILTLDVGKWVPNLGALIKMLVFAALIIGAGLHLTEHDMANPITASALLPTWGGTLQYLPVIIYGMLGFELVSAGADEMHNPRRDVPVAIAISGAIIIALYTLATVAILAAVPAAEVNLVEGLVDTLRLFFGGSSAGEAFALVLGIGALFTFFSNGVTWALGCNRAMAEASLAREMPAAFGIEHPRHRTPVGAAVAMGVVSTVALLGYGLLAGTNEDLFWTLFAFSAVIFLFPYVVMVLAFVRLRASHPAQPRPFRVPGPDGVAMGLGWVCALVLGLTMVLFVYTPGEGMQWTVLGGAVVVMVLGEVLIRAAEPRRG